VRGSELIPPLQIRPFVQLQILFGFNYLISKSYFYLKTVSQLQASPLQHTISQTQFGPKIYFFYFKPETKNFKFKCRFIL